MPGSTQIRQVMPGLQCRTGGVGQHETTGTVGTLGNSLGKTRLTDQCGLLIAGNSKHRHAAAERTAVGVGVGVRAVMHFRQQAARHRKQFKQFLVPLLGMNIEQHCSRGITRIRRVYAAAAEAPEYETVDRAESELAGFGALARTGHIVQEPGNLAGGEIRIQPETGLCRDRRISAVRFHCVTVTRRPAVLPDDRIVNAAAGCTLPKHRGLTLVGDADAGDVGGIC
jgi:hypothetical protein